MLSVFRRVRKFGVAMKNASTRSSRMATAPPRPPAAVAARTAPRRTRARTPDRAPVVCSATHAPGSRHDLLVRGCGRHGARDRALRQDQHPIPERSRLADLRGEIENPHALVGQPSYEPEDLVLGPDVDPPRRVVEHEEPRAGAQPPGEHDLLLGPARQRPGEALDARADRELVHVALGDGKLLAKVQNGAVS